MITVVMASSSNLAVLVLVNRCALCVVRCFCAWVVSVSIKYNCYIDIMVLVLLIFFIILSHSRVRSILFKIAIDLVLNLFFYCYIVFSVLLLWFLVGCSCGCGVLCVCLLCVLYCSACGEYATLNTRSSNNEYK